MQPSKNIIAEVFERNRVIHQSKLRDCARDNHLYVIFIIARSGSTWLTEMAEKSGALGTPQEWFNEGWIHTSETALGCRPPKLTQAFDVDEYISRTVVDYRSGDRVIGVQLSPYQTECVCDMLENPKEAIQLITPFYLRRRNIVAQAISMYRSAQSGFFHSYQETDILRERFEKVIYEAAEIAQWCEQLVAGEQFFESVFARLNINPARFVYEDIVGDPSSVLSWMRIKIKPSSRPLLVARSERMTVMGKNTSAEWEARFRAERGEFLAALDRIRPEVRSDFV